MISRVFLLLTLCCVGLSSYSNSQDILISIPKEVKAGEEFLVIINIPSNLLKGIAKLELELPNGFSANARNTANSEFQFMSPNASFRWLQFPVNQEVEISASVIAPKSVDGYFVFKASAYYLSDNEPVKINIEPRILTLTKTDNLEDDMVLLGEKTTITFNEFKSEGVACIRQVPYLKDGEVYVNLLVNKGGYSKYGKIQEKIPPGYKVSNMKSHNAIFIYNERQHIIKYMWMNLPDKEKFVVSYKLIPTQDIDDSNPFLIFGDFFYAEKNQTKSVEIKERGIDLDNLK